MRFVLCMREVYSLEFKSGQVLRASPGVGRVGLGKLTIYGFIGRMADFRGCYRDEIKCVVN